MAIKLWPEACVITEAPPSVAACQRPPGECKLSCHKQVTVTSDSGPGPVQSLPASGNPVSSQLPAWLAQGLLLGPEARSGLKKGIVETCTQQALPGLEEAPGGIGHP